MTQALVVMQRLKGTPVEDIYTKNSVNPDSRACQRTR